MDVYKKNCHLTAGLLPICNQTKLQSLTPLRTKCWICKNQIVSELCFLFNRIISARKLSKEWRFVNVTVHKKTNVTLKMSQIAGLNAADLRSKFFKLFFFTQNFALQCRYFLSVCFSQKTSNTDSFNHRRDEMDLADE